MNLLDQIVSNLAALPSNASAQSINDNLRLVSELGHTDRLEILLRHILSDTSTVQQIAGRSYRHVNHFDKIVLIDSIDPTAYRLTLHLWSPPYTASEMIEELIHDHRFNFWSRVLVGSLESVPYTRDPSGAIYRHFQYLPEDRTSTSFYKFFGETRLMQGENVIRPIGTAYFLSFDNIHRVLLPNASLQCTLVLRGPRQRVTSNIFNTSYPKADVQTAPVMFSNEQLKRKILFLLENLPRENAAHGQGKLHSQHALFANTRRR